MRYLTYGAYFDSSPSFISSIKLRTVLHSMAPSSGASAPLAPTVLWSLIIAFQGRENKISPSDMSSAANTPIAEVGSSGNSLRTCCLRLNEFACCSNHSINARTSGACCRSCWAASASAVDNAGEMSRHVACRIMN